MGLLNNTQQEQVSYQNRLPVDNVGTDTKTTISAGTITLKFISSGALTNDAAEAAGTNVVGILSHRNIKNDAGDATANWKNTSLSFTSTALTDEKPFPYTAVHQIEESPNHTMAEKMAAAVSGFVNGEYCVDYAKGVIYGKKADTSATLTSTSYKVESSGTGAGQYSEDTAHVSGDSGNQMLAVRNDAGTTLAGTDGDYAPLQVSATGALYVDASASSNDATHDSAVSTDGPQVMHEAKTFDKAALPNAVTEGDAVRAAATEQGVAYSFLVTQDGSGTPLELENDTMDSNKPLMVTGHTVADYDGAAFPTLSDTEGKAVSTAVSQQGVQYFFPVTEDGAESPMTNEDEAMAAGQAGYACHYKRADFDGAQLPTAADTEGDAVVPTASAQGVQYVTLMSEDGSDYGQIKGYDSGTDSLKMFDVAPISSEYGYEVLADETNATDGTYNYYIEMDGYRNLAIQYQDVSGGSGTATLKVYASITGDVDITSADYQDVTNAWFGSASFTADAFLEKDTPTPVKYVKVEVVASTGAANDADWALFAYKQY